MSLIIRHHKDKVNEKDQRCSLLVSRSATGFC